MKLLVLLLVVIKFASCAKILAHFITPSISHQKVYQNVWKELSLRGHQVTVITPDPLNDKRLVNLTEIDVHSSYGVMKKVLATIMDDKNNDILKQLKRMVLEYWTEIFDAQLENPQAEEIYLGSSKNKEYDLVVAEMVYPVVYPLANKYNCPFVGMLSLSGIKYVETIVGNPSHPALYPDVLTGYDDTKTFWQRFYSTYFDLMINYMYEWELVPGMDKKAREVFGDDIPYLGDIERNVSLILQSANFITVKPRPIVPALIEIHSTHLTKNTTLPKELKKELDEAVQGVIYFSLGSNVKSANLTSQLKNVIISAFSELPYKVLWKWESDYFPNKPDNVVTRQWLPQEGVLAHPNVKMFITQGGLQSMEEALFYKVPLLGMPFFGDQASNVNKMVQMGIGLQMDRSTVTKEEMKSKILEIMKNNKYRQKIAEVSDIVNDQPMTGVEKAVWWIEYVIRHKGAKHLRSPLLDMPLYQYLFLDIIVAVIGVTSFAIFLIVFTTKRLLKCIKYGPKLEKKKSS